MKNFRSWFKMFIAIIVLAVTAPTMGQSATITGLGDLAGGTISSYGFGVSDDGSVVVGNSNSASGTEAFSWTSGGGMVGLGDLPGGSFYSWAMDVSADGSTIVGFSNSASGTEAFHWTSGGGMVGLGGIRANGVSADGSVVVGTSNSGAFRWTSGGGMVGLGTLPGGTSSNATRVSSDGLVVVGSGDVASGDEAFRWTSGGGMVGLGDFPGGNHDSRANGVSADGSVVVGRGVTASGDEAFRWTSGGGLVGLGDLPGGVFASEAFGVSADGSVVVGQSRTISGYEAFIWDATNGMRRLQDVLVANGANLLGWYKLTIAFEISPDGNYVVGTGLRDFGSESFVAYIGPLLLDSVTELLPEGESWGMNGPTATSWQWYKDDVAIPGGTDQIFSCDPCALADTGAYKVEYVLSGVNHTTPTIDLEVRNDLPFGAASMPSTFRFALALMVLGVGIVGVRQFRTSS